MIRIKAVDAQNLLDVCQLKTSQNHLCRGRSCCNAVSIAEAKYCPELHPNAVYHNNTLIGFSCISARKITPIRRPSAAL